jgi:YbbR domain-containing protein
MQSIGSPNRRLLLNNLVWFIGSMVLAFFIWMIATLQSDPIQQQRYRDRIPVQMNADTGLLVTYPAVANRQASVVIRAPSSVLDLLTSDEIVVSADLSGLTAGDHTVELKASLARQQTTVVDISPHQMHVVLEEAAQRQVPLRAVITSEPPAGYSRSEPVFNVNLNQVLASGASTKVNDVVAAQVELDLRQQRNPLEIDLRLTPVDADGNVVNDVTLDPQVVRVNVNIRRREDVREISVRPNVQGMPPEGYVLNTLSYEPQSVLVSGTPSVLAGLQDTLSTQPIDLSNHTSNFEVSVPVILPNSDLLLLSGQNITVSVEIKPVTTSRQFDAIPVKILGIDSNSNLSVKIAPNTVSVLVNGPQEAVNQLTADDVKVALDLNGLAPGNYTLPLTVSVGQGQIPTEGVSVLPGEVDIQIIDNSVPTPEETAESP